MDTWIGFEAAALGGAQRLRFRAGGGWSLAWPCSTCGGVVLPLAGHQDDLEDQLARGAELVSDQVCPGCRTLAGRADPPDVNPEVWYDTMLREWVVRLPFDWIVEPLCDANRGPIIPLGLPWFDVPLSLVFNRAADVVCGADVLIEDPARD